MARGLQGVMLRGLGAREHTATVLETVAITPNFIRVRMVSPTIFDDAVLEPTAWLRFWFPDPDGSSTEHQRAYTLSEGDPATGRFAVDILVHEPAGPASTWVRTVTAGATITAVSLMGSARFDTPAGTADQPAGYLLIGDAASITGFNGIIGAVPADVPIECYLEQHDTHDALIPLADHPRLRVHRVARRDATSLAAAIETRDWSNWYAWATPESATLKHVRARLRDEFGFPKSELHTQAYWTAGRAMGTLRDSEPAPAAEQPDDTTPPAAPGTAPGSWRARGAGRLLAPLRTPLIVSGVLAGLVTLVGLAPFVLLVQLARLLITGADTAALWHLGLAAVGLLGLGTGLGAALTLWLHVIDTRFAHILRTDLLAKLSRLPLGWFTARGSGAIKALVTDDTLALHYLVTHAIPDAVAAVVAPVAVLAYLFAVDWRVTLVLFAPVLVYLVTTSSMTVQSGPRIHQAARWAETMNAEAGGYLEGQPVIRVFGGAAASSFRRRLDDYIGFLVSWQRPLAGKKTLMDLATRPATFLWLITAVGTALIVTGRMDPVNLLPFLLLGTAFGGQLLGIAYGLGGIRAGLAAARRLQNTLDEPDLAVRDIGRTGTDPAGTVVFDRVDFGYRPGVPVIHQASLTLAPGTVTALVGPSGSGKSTLAALLARFHDVDAGAIRIDGIDIAAMTADELYARVGFVLQETQLVHASVRDNIALAAPDATDAQVHAAARAAQIHDRILRLPNGYDTVLGAGVGLSGGERQRLTIARAILADTPVLILDEATAFADPESEYLVQRALDELTRDRTVLVIAHRLHTITAADQILVLDAGRIVERGTHRQLLAAGGRYQRLWATGERELAAVAESAR